MRNIKTTLRLSRNSALLMAAATGLVYLTGCSSELPSNSSQEVEEAAAANESYTVYSADQSRVHNFGNEGTRAATDFTMPGCPSVPTDAESTTDKQGWQIDQIQASNVVIPTGETCTEHFKGIKGKTYYVAGTLQWTYFQEFAQGVEIYVLPGGTFQMGGTLPNGLTVYNYGDVVIPNGLTVSGSLYSTTDIDANGDVGIDGNFMSKGSMVADKVRLNGNAAACSFTAEQQITFNGTGNFKASYFKAALLEMNTGNVVLDNNGLLDADVIYCSNGDTRFTVDGTNAVIATRKFLTNNKDWPKNIFSDSALALDFKYCGIGNTYYDNETSFNEMGLIISDETNPAYVPVGDCHPAYGTPPDSGEDPGVTEGPDDETVTVTEIVKVAEIDPLEPEHDHGNISATCINFGTDGTAYASYHLRGAGQKGCIEVIKDNGASGLSLGSYMIADSFDFNHIFVDEEKIITVGNHTRKAAFVGRLSTNFAASEGVREDFYVKELTTDEVLYGKNESGDQIRLGHKNAGDGNCIVRYGDNYLFTSYRGYGAISATDLTRVPGTFHATNGSSKHIALSGDKAVVLSHDTYDNTSSTASVESWSLTNGTFASVLASYDAIGTISPVDGKNVVAIDGDDIYACLSQGGLARIRQGQVETRTFGSGKLPVNGLAIDENYLYVAAGSFVYVLEKESMASVCHYHAPSQKSANYIALNNGKIYVAYGEDGIQVFQLVHKTIEL